MKNILRFQFFLTIFLLGSLGLILIKTTKAAPSYSYEKKDTYIYYTDQAAECKDGKVVKKDTDKVLPFGDCSGADVVCATVRNESSGRNEVGCFVQKVEPTPQEPTPTPTESPSRPTPVVRSSPTPDCPLTKEEYNQCGKTEGLEDKLATNTYHIIRYVDCKGVIKKYDLPQDLGDLGQCGSGSVSQPTITPAISPTIPPSIPPDNNPPDNSYPTNPPPTTAKYRVAASYLNLQTAQWQPYTKGGVIVSAPSDIYSIDATFGKKAIYVQFMDSNNQIIKFSNGSEVAVEYIDLEKPTEVIAKVETSPTVSGTNRTWQPTSVKVTLSGFKETGESLAAVFVRNQAGECTVENCGFIGWTKIKTYGTNGTDQFMWTPKPGDLTAGIHMFGVFSLNPDGTGKELLSVSATNYINSQ